MLAAAAAFGFATLSPIAPTANAAGSWASIAYSPDTGAYGYGYNAGSKDEAINIAMGYCYQYGGTDCQVAASAASGCLALADSPTHWSGGLGVTQPAAEADALYDNGGGTILVSGCTGA
jgi:hypothetical protein